MPLALSNGSDSNDPGQHDPDRAVGLFRQLLTIQPDNVEARQALRRIERQRGDARGGRTPVMVIGAYFRGVIPILKIGLYSLLHCHDKRILECEEFLQYDPYCGPVLQALANSARQCGYDATASYVEQDLADRCGHRKR